jgi:hypothetical protein
MDLIIYLNQKIYLTLSNGYYYQGLVLSADENSLTLLDKNNKKVSLSKESIMTIRELS